MNDAPEPLKCHCLAARQLARHVSRLYERHLAQAQITSAQFSILNFLQRRPGMSMRELSAEMVMDRTTLLRAIKPLQRNALVASATEAGSTQAALSLTRKGARKIEAARPLWQAAQDEYEAQVGTERAARLRRDLLEVVK